MVKSLLGVFTLEALQSVRNYERGLHEILSIKYHKILVQKNGEIVKFCGVM